MSLIYGIQKSQTNGNKEQNGGCEAGDWEKLESVGQRVDISSYKMSKFQGPNVQYGDHN